MTTQPGPSATSPATQHSPASPEDQQTVPVRRVEFSDLFADVPKNFAGDGDPLASHLVAVLSAVFPPGEEYFVRTVRHYRDRITDPALRQAVNGFIGQESIHGREHRALNDLLAHHGYPVRTIEKVIDGALRLRERVLPAHVNLATTAALEHFTAVFAEELMTNPDLRAELTHPAVRNLLEWHALEEAEHKAVAFDVYRFTGGSERARIWTMKSIRLGFMLFLLQWVPYSVLRYGDGVGIKGLVRSFRQKRVQILLNRRMWNALREYDRPGFHPNDRNTAHLVGEWRERLFGDDGDIVELLPSRAA